MKYPLDANVCIHFLRKKGSPLFKQRLLAHPPSDLVLCAPVKAELYHGAACSANPAASRAQVDAFVRKFLVLPMDDAAASTYAAVRFGLEAKGWPIGAFDVLIAAIALNHNLTLVTHNVGEFSRVSGLTLEDWEVP
jgi:tRNA(fMet)-specific endonuclease VapC